MQDAADRQGKGTQVVNEPIIRQSELEDVDALRSALDAVARERKYIALLEAPSREDLARFMLQPHVAQVVAVDGAEVIGWADVQQIQCPGFTHRGSLGMAVARAHRRRGIGRRLLDAVVIAARELGVTRLELQVFRSNQGAVALYQRCGFELEGEQLGARVLDGGKDDILLMRRWI
jgi:ribosomal protein S18 acetylase RimI-like enzyme